MSSSIINPPSEIGAAPQKRQDNQNDNSSYAQILKSSSIIGGAQVINMLIGLVRTKLVAILIGPSGVGLIGMYQSITGMTSTITGLGIQTSGVRDVARHYGQGDAAYVAKTVQTLRRICWFTGFAGMLLLVSLASTVSQLTFGSNDYTWAIAVLAVTVLFGNITSGQIAAIQGMRRIGDLARINILGALAGTVVTGIFYAALGTVGIVPAMVSMSIVTLAISTYYASKLRLEPVVSLWSETWSQAKSMIEMGITLVIAGILASLGDYGIRWMITSHHGLAGVGVYTAAFNLSGMFVQFVLGSMGADFYPRLTAVCDDHGKMAKLINEQTEVGLLMAFPGLLATLAFAPLVVSTLYTSEFSAATELLRWFVLGCMGRVLSWPLGFSLLAKGQGRLYMGTEVIFTALHVGLVEIGLKQIGLLGVGVAFTVLYAFYTIAMLLIMYYSIGFRWSSSVVLQIAWMVPVVAGYLVVLGFVAPSYAIVTGAALTIISVGVTLKMLVSRLGENHRVSRIYQAMIRLNFARSKRQIG